jgi:hypothetical protein
MQAVNGVDGRAGPATPVGKCLAWWKSWELFGSHLLVFSNFDAVIWPFINDVLKLLLLSNIITIARHAWNILSYQIFQHQPGSGSDHHTGSMLANFRQFFMSVPWIQWT